MIGNLTVPRLAGLTIAGALAFAASVGAMHAIQPELSVAHDAVSYYMNGPWGWVLAAGLVAMGLGSFCLLDAIRRGVGVSRAGLWALGVWGAGAAVGGLFAPDPIGSWNKPPSVSGMMHGGAAMVAFLAFPVAAVTLSHARGWRMGGGRFLPVLAWTCVAFLVAFFATLAPAFADRAPRGLGITERLVLGANVAWLVAAGSAVRKL